MFDCINNNEFDKISKEILHIPCHTNCSCRNSNLLINLSFKNKTNEILNFIAYLNSIMNYGYHYNLLKHISNNNMKYISTEANQDRLFFYDNLNKNEFQISNRYIMLEKPIDMEFKYHRKFMFYSNYLNTIGNAFILVLILYGIYNIITQYLNN